MKKVQLSDFTAAPDDGVVVKSVNPNTARVGLKLGDVFVALDGYRVQTLEQYMLIRALTDDPHLTLIVWNRNKYVEIETSLPDRRFDCKIETYMGR